MNVKYGADISLRKKNIHNYFSGINIRISSKCFEFHLIHHKPTHVIKVAREEFSMSSFQEHFLI